MPRTNALGLLPRVLLCVVGSSLGRALAETETWALDLPQAPVTSARVHPQPSTSLDTARARAPDAGVRRDPIASRALTPAYGSPLSIPPTADVHLPEHPYPGAAGRATIPTR
jgi:hypothetical protein